MDPGAVVLIIAILFQFWFILSLKHIISLKDQTIESQETTIQIKDKTIKMQEKWLDQYHRDVMNSGGRKNEHRKA